MGRHYNISDARWRSCQTQHAQPAEHKKSLHEYIISARCDIVENYLVDSLNISTILLAEDSIKFISIT